MFPLHFCYLVLYVLKRPLVKQRKMFFISLRKLFCSWDNQILKFQVFKCYDVINANNSDSKQSLVMEIGQLMQYYQRKIYEEYGLETSLIFKKSSGKRNLRNCARWFWQIKTDWDFNHSIHSRQTLLVRAKNLQQKVAIRLLARHVLLELAIVSQEHLQETGFLAPHL